MYTLKHLFSFYSTTCLLVYKKQMLNNTPRCVLTHCILRLQLSFYFGVLEHVLHRERERETEMLALSYEMSRPKVLMKSLFNFFLNFS